MQWQFGDYRLDLNNECLWQGEQRLSLRPKTFELLRYLVERADQMISKETLMTAVWSDTVVSDGVLTTSIAELRKLFSETAKTPQFIATVHRRGYRFIAPVKCIDGVVDELIDTTNSATKHPTIAQTLVQSNTPFIGRQRELETILELLINEPVCRLLTLLGPGGIGKTRLALAVAENLLEKPPSAPIFPDGVFFVALQALNNADNIAATIAEALNYRFHGTQSTRQQLLNYLQPKQLLLILDNFEHLLNGVEILTEILATASQIKLLVTSRDLLGLPAAWLHRIDGMSYPSSLAETETKAEYDAIKLFQLGARRIGITLDTTADQQQVARICRLTEGMPLALELAAAWLKVLSVEEIADEIEKNFDILSAQHDYVPERQRSLRVVFTYAWQHLSSAEQAVLKKLSVFRGGCTREAAERVSGATLPVLAALVDQSLLRYSRPGRYELHELVRQFSEEKLKLSAHTADYRQVRELHIGYYADWLASLEPALNGENQLAAVNQIVADLDNVRQAWFWAADDKNLNALRQLLISLQLFYEMRGLVREGEAIFRYALDQFADPSEPALSSTDKLVLGQLLARHGNLMIRVGSYSEGIDSMERGAALLRQTGNSGAQDLAWVLAHIGEEVYFQGKSIAAKQYLLESLTLAEQINDQQIVGKATLYLGQLAEFQGEYRQALPYFERSLSIFEKLGDHRAKAFSLNNQARVAYATGAYTKAAELIQAGFEIRQRLNDQIGIAYSLLDKGKLAIAVGQYHDARKDLQQGLAIAEKIGERDLQARILNGLGVASRLMGELAQAEREHQQSLSIYRDIGVQRDIPFSLNQLGRIALDNNQLASAEQLFRESLKKSETLQNRGELACALRNLGELTARQNEHDLALAQQYYQQALTIAADINAIPLMLDILLGIAEIFRQHDDADNATKLLALVATHPASSHASKEKAHFNWDGNVTDQLKCDLWQVVNALLQE